MPVRHVEINVCPWCMKEHRRKPKPCINAMYRLIMRYDKNDRPQWVTAMVEELSSYLKGFEEDKS